MLRRTAYPVKPTRVAPRSTRRFGAGILAYVPHAGRMPYTTADLDWLATQGVAGPDDAEFDRMADAAASLDRYTQGFCL